MKIQIQVKSIKSCKIWKIRYTSQFTRFVDIVHFCFDSCSKGKLLGDIHIQFRQQKLLPCENLKHFFRNYYTPNISESDKSCHFATKKKLHQQKNTGFSSGDFPPSSIPKTTKKTPGKEKQEKKQGKKYSQAISWPQDMLSDAGAISII